MYTENVTSYVYEVKQIRKLKWEIKIKTNSTNNFFNENLISRTFDYTLSGYERAISRKYKKLLDPLTSKEDMIKEAINEIYKKTKYQL